MKRFCVHYYIITFLFFTQGFLPIMHGKLRYFFVSKRAEKRFGLFGWFLAGFGMILVVKWIFFGCFLVVLR